MLIRRYLNSANLFRFDDDIATGAPSASEETPDVNESGPESGTPADQPQDINWEQRYNDLRPEFDRRAQEVSEYRQLHEILAGNAGPEARAEALSALGVELQDDDSYENENDDDPEARLERVEQALEQQKAEAERSARQSAEDDFLVEGIEALEGHAGREFTEQEITVLADVARANRDEHGVPDLEKAYSHLEGLLKASKESWIASKKVSRSPGSGIAASEAVDLNDPEARVRQMAALMEQADVD